MTAKRYDSARYDFVLRYRQSSQTADGRRVRTGHRRDGVGFRNVVCRPRTDGPGTASRVCRVRTVVVYTVIKRVRRQASAHAATLRHDRCSVRAISRSGEITIFVLALRPFEHSIDQKGKNAFNHITNSARTRF